MTAEVGVLVEDARGQLVRYADAAQAVYDAMRAFERAERAYVAVVMEAGGRCLDGAPLPGPETFGGWLVTAERGVTQGCVLDAIRRLSNARHDVTMAMGAVVMARTLAATKATP